MQPTDPDITEALKLVSEGRTVELNENKFVQDNKPGRGYVCTDVYASSGQDIPDFSGEIYLDYHLSGNALFTDTVHHTQFVFGVDEDTYFGCELPAGSRFSLAVDALMALAPVEARVYPKRKSSPLKDMVLRQGEWFFVPSNEFPSPNTHPTECLCIAESVLPKMDLRDSNHVLCGDSESRYGSYSLPQDIEQYAWVHLPTGDIWVQCGNLTHSEGDHADVCIPDDAGKRAMNEVMTTAWKVLRNLAVRSFSEQGVD